MIRLLRKIRKKLIANGRFRKYSLYAFGEIALVMIGILLALQVNNWNEQRKSRLSENQALVDLKDEFMHNHERLLILIDTKKEQEARFRSYMNFIIDDKNSIADKMAAKIPSGNRARWGIVNTVLSSLINTGAIDNIQNDSLKTLLTQWPITTDKFSTYEDELTESIKAWRNYMAEFSPRAFNKGGDYRGDWPGNEHPPNMAKKINQYKSPEIESVRHYNHLGDLIDRLYIYLILTTQLSDQYELIISLLDQEISLRTK